MKAALLFGPEDLRVVKAPDPIAASGEVVVRVVCYSPYGTDLQAYRGDGGSLPAKLPAGIGADFSGVIASVGYRVTGFAPGDRVVACTLAHCGLCRNCRAGRTNLCLDPAYANGPRQTACQEYTIVPANKLAKLDPAVSFEDGAMTWSTIDALNAAEKLKPQPDETVAVIGVGAMGWGAIALFKALGATVVAVGGTGQRADLARKLGADAVIPLQHYDEDVTAQVMAAYPGGVACIFETTATDWGVRQGLAIASVGGRMAVTGGKSVIGATGWDFVRKELVVYGIHAGHQQDIALELLRRGKIDLKPTVTHRMSLDEAPAAFRLLTGADRANIGRIIINVTKAKSFSTYRAVERKPIVTLLWPNLLWLGVLLALLPFAYVWLLRRRKRAIKFANLDLIRQAVAGRTSVRRHLPPLLFFVSLALMAFALTRPAAIVTLPSERATIILAIDVSGSMRARDVEPTRMAAAQAAARDFVSGQPNSVRIGLVAFSGNAMVAAMPTLVRQDVLDAIDRLRPQRYTAVGSGIVASLQAIFPEMESEQYLSSLSAHELLPATLGTRPDTTKPAAQPVPPGSFASAVVILLSDGRTNVGMPPLDAAHIAADRGVRVFTVGFGKPDGAVTDFGGGMMRMQPDEETLIAIAEITHAKHFNAQTATELKEIYKSLSTQFVAETKRTELTAIIAAPALIFLLIAVALSLIWSNRMTS